MNTIIIHPNNRIPRTPEHDLSDILIAPVSRWYRKPTPWWVDRFEEVGLQPIVETDEIVEESEVDEDPEFAQTGDDIAIEFPQSTESGDLSNVGADIFEDESLGDIDIDNDLHGIEESDCNMTDLFEDVIIVDEDDKLAENADDDDTVMDITFIGEAATFILCLPENDEWDEKVTLSIFGPEFVSGDELDGDDTFYGNYPSGNTSQFFQ